MQRNILLSVAVLAFGLLCFSCLQMNAPEIQQDIAERVVRALAAQHISSQVVNVDGRDVLLTGPAHSVQVSQATQNLVAGVEGVRLVSLRTTAADSLADAGTISKTEAQRKMDTLLQQDIVEFDPASADLTAHGRAVLDQAVQVLTSAPTSYWEIQGHTDSQGNPESNRDLSYRRAIEVKNYLVNHGIPPARLTTDGYGDTKPVASNETAEGRRQNRRINFVLREKP